MSVLWNALGIPLHIAGFTLYCVGFGLEIIVLGSLLWARFPTDVIPILRHVSKLKWIMITATVMVFVSGVTMAQHQHWGYKPWNICAVIVILLMLPFAAAYKDPKFEKIRTEAVVDWRGNNNEFSDHTTNLICSRLLLNGAFAGMGMFLSLATVIMPTKPGWVGCTAWLLAGALGGVIVAAVVAHRSPIVARWAWIAPRPLTPAHDED